MTDASPLQQHMTTLLRDKPYLGDFFSAIGVLLPRKRMTLDEFLASIDPMTLKRASLDLATLRQQCLEFIEQMERFEREATHTALTEITILGGFDKNNRKEQHDLTLRPGEITAVVGPTGSGKSRLLGDIECLAQGDTPTGRRILINGQVPDEAKRLSGDQQLVAQLSQNMNFVMDLSVREFLEMHASSRLVQNKQERIEQVFTMATALAGEPFRWSTPITALSGGQSRALMIADVACLSNSPIVLIDEIENAGVDRQKALELLVEKDKIVLLATHDPLLALSAHKRLIIQNGGIAEIITTSVQEQHSLQQLGLLDKQLTTLRHQIRSGQRISFELSMLFGHQSVQEAEEKE